MKQVYVLIDAEGRIRETFKTKGAALASVAPWEGVLGYDGKTQRIEVQRFIAVPMITPTMCAKIAEAVTYKGYNEISVQELKDIIFQEIPEALPNCGTCNNGR